MTNKNEEYQKQKPKPQKSKGLRILGTIALIGLITGAMLACLAAIYIKNVILPDAELQLSDVSLHLTTTMYYTDSKNGNPVEMRRLYGDENRIWIDYNKIPKDLVNAAVAVEDKRFYDHHGVDWVRTMKGVINMFTGQDIQGGSTITQQLIKNLTNEDQVTVKRKITEIFRALSFEKNYSKQDILEWYLNYIYLGENCNGVYTASYTYFGRPVSELSLAQCASLIGITNNPSRYDPYLNKEENKKRQELILKAMYEQGYIQKDQYDKAVSEKLAFVRGEDESKPKTVYTWYEDAVISDVIEDLQTAYNLSNEAATNMVYSGGLKIYSCMDPEVQSAVDAVYMDRSNLNYTSNAGQPMQSAITVVNNETGSVVAVAGGMGEKTSSRAWNRATKSLRPPGSSIKPLSVYSPAIELGYITPVSIVEDSPYSDGWPVNSFGRYRGLTSITDAVKDSVNTIAVKVLANYVTPEVSFQFMRERYNIKLVESRTVGDTVYSDIALAPLALGGLTDGVSTYDMAGAYSVFSRDGVYIAPHTYTKVLDNDGNVLLESSTEGKSVLEQRTTYYMTNLMKNVVSSGTGTRANFSGQDVAGKTGTTSNRLDLWFVGYTPYYTAAVWTGYDQQEAMSSGVGNPSTTLFKAVMQKVHAKLPYKPFNKPDDVVAVRYCTKSGLLAKGSCGGNVATAYLLKKDVPTNYCNVHANRNPHPSTEEKAFDINDQSTWPTNDPNFKPDDSKTWPGQKPAETETPPAKETPEQETKPPTTAGE